jgi:hypothetical protein
MENPPKCPRCQSDEVLPIRYGRPTTEMVEEALAGRAVLGGSMFWPEAPDWECGVCGRRWREEESGF